MSFHQYWQIILSCSEQKVVCFWAWVYVWISHIPISVSFWHFCIDLLASLDDIFVSQCPVYLLYQVWSVMSDLIWSPVTTMPLVDPENYFNKNQHLLQLINDTCHSYPVAWWHFWWLFTGFYIFLIPPKPLVILISLPWY